MKKKLVVSLAMGLFLGGMVANVSASMIGYADVVLDYYNSGAGPFPTPYGGTWPGSFPVSVSTDVVLEDDGDIFDFLSLPSGSYVTVGFTDETIIDGVGDDVFIQETGANGETAEVYVSSNGVDFVFLGIAKDDFTTSLDLASIGYTEAVQAIKIVGLDNFGGSPGFDVVNIQIMPGSIGPAPEVPWPIDIKPTSCPNPLNFKKNKSKAVIPVAIVGDLDLPVEAIDLNTILLEGVAPLRYSYEDVATPYSSDLGLEDALSCTTEGPDGSLDLILHFNRQEIIEALSQSAQEEIMDGDVLTLKLSGNLLESYGSERFIGKDVMIIRKNENGKWGLIP